MSLTGKWHPGLAGPFVLYRFGIQPAIVHLEHYRSGVFLVDEADVTAYESAADMIRQEAMSPDESAKRIAEILNALEASS
ncbi:Scr1 family TA system antitoxin-like transcriptional regulator [Kibdelosporangium persicum]|uniref:Scr1 family TA system antitoxin-like transcriptional regulator n=1 Tax=Kibdelosporangium persicum TaxID=2698649 RepID=UPI00156727F9|nr:Scr1 family TA system antitoxin-like transcriptional regulator [Kibdelosporangium persicum]